MRANDDELSARGICKIDNSLCRKSRFRNRLAVDSELLSALHQACSEPQSEDPRSLQVKCRECQEETGGDLLPPAPQARMCRRRRREENGVVSPVVSASAAAASNAGIEGSEKSVAPITMPRGEWRAISIGTVACRTILSAVRPGPSTMRPAPSEHPLSEQACVRCPRVHDRVDGRRFAYKARRDLLLSTAAMALSE